MQNSYLVAGSIFFGCMLVAASLYASGTSAFTTLFSSFTYDQVSPMRDDNRHVTGAENPKITLVEYSDLECPFCASLHPTLERLVAEHPETLEWEFRHLPLSIHPHARIAAQGSECVAKLNGEEAFWLYVTNVYKDQQNLSEALLVSHAEDLRVPREAFLECLHSDEIAAIVQDDMDTAARFGGRGTPFVVLVLKDGTYKTVSGALPYEQWKTLLSE